jgi:hypothetical protein
MVEGARSGKCVAIKALSKAKTAATTSASAFRAGWCVVGMAPTEKELPAVCTRSLERASEDVGQPLSVSARSAVNASP